MKRFLFWAAIITILVIIFFGTTPYEAGTVWGDFFGGIKDFVTGVRDSNIQPLAPAPAAP